MEILDRPPGLGKLYRAAVLRRGSGDTLPGTTLALDGVTVDPGHLADYSRVCGFRLTGALPGTYPHVLAFPLAMALMTRPDFPFPLLGLVHLANRIEVRRPLSVEDRLQLRVRAEHLRPHSRGRQVDVVAEALAGDEVVWSGRSTYLRKEKGGAGGDGPAGTAHGGVRWKVDPGVGVAYARVSGDRNPIHTSRLAARLFGFRRPIAHGMWTKARCLAALEGRLPAGYAVEVNFRSPVRLPSTVEFSAHREQESWHVSVHDPRSGRGHLTGEVGPIPAP